MNINSTLKHLGAMVAATMLLLSSQQARAQDPLALGCNQGAYIVASQSIWGQFPVATWYSPRCNARYITLDATGFPAWQNPTKVVLFNAWNGTGARTWTWYGPYGYYSNLMPATGNMAACAQIWTAAGGVASNCSINIVVR